MENHPTEREPQPETLRLLASPALQHDQALAAIAGAFSPGEVRLNERLDELARRLFGAAELGARDQALALADLLTNRLGLISNSSDHRALLIDHALEQRQAHPLLIAALGHELARRAGISTCVGTCGGHPWTVVRDAEGVALVGPALPAGGATGKCDPLLLPPTRSPTRSSLAFARRAHPSGS